MIKRVGKDIQNGDFIEFNSNSEPLYLYTNGKLQEITNQEFNHICNFLPKERAWQLVLFRSSQKTKL